MTDTQKDDRAVQMKARSQLASEKDPVVRLRLQLLCRGANGIKGFSRQFRIMDDNGDKKLSKSEFTKGIHDFNVDIEDNEIVELFNTFDKDNSGSIEFNEFLLAVRPPLNEKRIALIKMAFQKMDRSGDGEITVVDLKGCYNARMHPKYQNGEWTEAQVFTNFLKSFEAPETTDGKVTWEEWLNYYAGVSSSIDNDSYFDLMMRNAWKL